jgi:hypothetical protein
MKPKADQTKAPEVTAGPKSDATDDLKTLPLPDVDKKLGSWPDGLSGAEAPDPIWAERDCRDHGQGEMRWEVCRPGRACGARGRSSR